MFTNGEKSEKTFTIFGGVNGVGKSTYRNNSGVSKFIIDPDDLSRSSVGSYKEALKKERELEEFYIRNDLSFGRETTLTGATIFKKIYNLKKHGYRINLIFLDVDDVDICIKRVAKRVAEGGHHIETSAIKRRYSKIMKNLKDNLSLFDDILFIDNSTGSNTVVGFYNGKVYSSFRVYQRIESIFKYEE